MNQKEVREAAAWLQNALPESDRMMLTEEDLNRIAEHCLYVRSYVPWGHSIPDNLFRTFVLFPRVNNEDPVFYHGEIWEELKDRLLECSMEEAIQRVNLWCYEKAVYQSTDDRTANPITIMKRAYGRCGEESVLLVSALRACGIPARQVYVPRWSHCDDNHAWVEAWDGKNWRYLGACEPEAELDSGWFTAAASKAMLVHTRAYGEMPEGEIIAGMEGRAYVVNRTPAYAKTAELTVRVTRNGQPLEGISVQFELLNMAEHYPIHTGITDRKGCTSLILGLGTIFLHVHDGQKYVETSVNVRKDMDPVEIRFENAVSSETEVKTIRQCPPEETRIQPVEKTQEARDAHRARMQEHEAIRLQYEASMDRSNRYLTAARGNHEEIRKFLQRDLFSMKDRLALLDTLREKDFVDATEELLTDALTAALPYKDRYPSDVWKESVLCPRVANEMLYPDRAWLKAHGPEVRSGRELWDWITSRYEVRDMDPVFLIPSMRSLFDEKEISPRMRDILFVNLCRAAGFAARLNPVTGEKEVWENGYHAVAEKKAEDAKLVLLSETFPGARFDVDVTVARLEDGVYRTLRMDGREVGNRLEMPVSSGMLRVICSTRQMDGSLDAILTPITLSSGETREIRLQFPEKRTREMIRCEHLLPLKALSETGEQMLPEFGMPSVLAQIAPGEEPTEHFLNELLDAQTDLEKRGIRVSLIVEKPEDAGNEKLQKVLRNLKDAQLFWQADQAALMGWRSVLHAGDLRLPLAVAVDAKGQGRFAFVNYHVGSVMSLLQVLDMEKE